MIARITVLCFPLVGCTSDLHDTGEAGRLPEPEVQHFAGSSEWLNPDGEAVLDPGQVWIRRELREMDSKVIEDLVSVDEAGAVSVYGLEVQVDGYRFEGSLEESNGVLQVSGELEGEDWAWTEWSSTSTYIEGSLVGYYFKTDTVLSDAGLTQEKRIYDDADVYLLNIIETLSPVGESEWRAEVEGLGVVFTEGATR